jgi:hypothetical protein
MSQVLHIFKKDTRHLWPEIVISFALTVAFVRVSIASSNENLVSPYFPIVAGLLSVLVPVGWWVLTVRLVHDESLVGENHFWVTRPYQWQKLLAAKALFLVAFLYLPIFIGQVVLLAGAGLHPFVYLPKLLFNLVLLTCVLVLPIVAIATVTSTFARFVLTLLGAVVYLGIIIWTFSSLPSPSNFPNPYENRLYLCLALCIFLLVITLQYATRRVWRSRWLLLALPFLLIICSYAWPSRGVARLLYPPLATAGSSPIQLTFDPNPDRQSPAPVSHLAKRVDLYLPLEISGIPSGSLMRNLATRISIHGPNGRQWNSKWQETTNYYSSDATRAFINVPIDTKFLESIQTTPVAVTMTIAFVQLRASATITSHAGDQNFSIPGGGVCSVSNSFGTFPTCRFAMAEPALTHLTAYWSDGPCSQTPAQNGPGNLGEVWLGTIDPDFVDFGLNPVKIKPLYFSNQPQDTSRSSFICPGTPINATPYIVERRFQTSLTVPDLDLTKYTVDRTTDRNRRLRSSATVTTSH